MISWIVKQGNYWATAGHIPALKAVTELGRVPGDAAERDLCGADGEMVYDPQSKYAGVASPIFDAAGNAFTAAVNGEEEPADAVDMMKEELDAIE